MNETIKPGNIPTNKAAEYRAVCEATGAKITYFPRNGVPEVYSPSEGAIFRNFKLVVDPKKIGVDAIS